MAVKPLEGTRIFKRKSHICQKPLRGSSLRRSQCRNSQLDKHQLVVQPAPVVWLLQDEPGQVGGTPMRASEVAEMSRLPLFRGVAADRVTAMLEASFLQRFPERVELAREAEPADFLHVIVDGQVEIYSAHLDRETTVAVLGPGQIFIVAAVVLDRIYLKSARSLTPARILLVPAKAVRACFAEDAAFARALAVELAVAYRLVVKDLKNQKLRPGLERLANWLLACRTERDNASRFELPFEKKVLAARLGIAPEVLSRSFAALAPYKVKVTGTTIEIRDVETLTRLARPSATIDDPST
jgi:CRP/FNR family transcriptional activator FtrB